MSQKAETTLVNGRCYCGACSVSASQKPTMVTYCHCNDCRRWTGAPVAAFAQFPSDAVSTSGTLNTLTSVSVNRQFCSRCGSPLLSSYDYLPGQIYVALGCLDQAAEYPPELHCHDRSRLPWLCLTDDLHREADSGRGSLLQSDKG